MDLVEDCQQKIAKNIEDLKKFIAAQHVEDDLGGEEFLQTQNMINAAVVDRDKNLDKILDQQASIKTIIETDNVIRALRKNIDQDNKAIESLRKSVAKLGMDAMKYRSDLLESQAKDVERFQMHQLKSIAEDYKRHQEILEFRKKEIADMKKEIEKEETGREAYLADFEKNLEKQLQARQNSRGQGGSLFPMSGLNDDVDDLDELELTSINEYAPYGAVPGTKTPTKKRQTSRGRGRGRRGPATR